MSRKLRALIFCAALACLGVIVANAQTERPAFDPLRGLKHALETAGAPALSSQQEDQLKTLIQQFRDAHKSHEPDPALGTARKAYDAAILAGDAAAATAQAQTIANLIATHSSDSLKAEAGFQIQALAIIKSNPQQFDALVQKFGNSGVVRLLGGLAGGGRFGGPGPGGFRGGPGAGPGGRPGGFGDGANGFNGAPRSRRP